MLEWGMHPLRATANYEKQCFYLFSTLQVGAFYLIKKKKKLWRENGFERGNCWSCFPGFEYLPLVFRMDPLWYSRATAEGLLSPLSVFYDSTCLSHLTLFFVLFSSLKEPIFTVSSYKGGQAFVFSQIQPSSPRLHKQVQSHECELITEVCIRRFEYQRVNWLLLGVAVPFCPWSWKQKPRNTRVLVARCENFSNLRKIIVFRLFEIILSAFICSC